MKKTFKIVLTSILLLYTLLTYATAANWLPMDGIMLKLGSIPLSAYYLVFETGSNLTFGSDKLTF